MAGGVDGAAPKLLAAIGDYADGTGPAPEELVDVTLMERFHWTLDELDEADMSRVLPAVAAANIYSALARVMPAMNAAAASGDLNRAPREDDLKVWFEVQQAQQERDA